MGKEKASSAKSGSLKVASETTSVKKDLIGSAATAVRLSNSGKFVGKTLAASMLTVRAKKTPEQVVRELTIQYEVPARDVADVLDITPRTFSRWKHSSKSLSDQQADRMMIVKSILDLGKTVLGSEEHVKDWLRKPLFLLDNQVPLDLMKTESGRRKVESALHQIHHGFF
jgi:putative toxin-antitoxin system antitoxin component (TIGR02293 family)